MRELRPTGYSLIGVAQANPFSSIIQLAIQVVCRVELPVNQVGRFIEFYPIDFCNFLIEDIDLRAESSNRYHSIIDGLNLLVDVEDDLSIVISFMSSRYYVSFRPEELQSCLVVVMKDLIENHFNEKKSHIDCTKFLRSIITKLSNN
ncbi:MAG: hypothetical protein ABJO41_14095 [Erythrobacter sp.]